MTDRQQRIHSREFSIVLGIIGLMAAIYFEYPYMQWAFSAYLMWNVPRLITHITKYIYKK